MAERSAELFAKCFGHAPRWMVAAPGRVNLIGEHTDYNDGFVLPMAIDRYIVIAADRDTDTPGDAAQQRRPGKPPASACARRAAASRPGPTTSAASSPASSSAASSVTGFDAVIESTLPFGGGLSSSAALEVATATLLEAMTGRALDPMEKALLCQQAEHDFAGVPCGIMDQFTSILAQEDHALLLDCRSRTTTPVPMTDPRSRVLIINTNVRHKLAESEYAKRRAQCEDGRARPQGARPARCDR